MCLFVSVYYSPLAPNPNRLSLPSQVRAFAETDVLIGIHGAGLASQIYMAPNSAVVEIAPYSNDARCVLGGGPFSRAAGA